MKHISSIYWAYADGKAKKVARRRQRDPSLPFNPENPYDKESLNDEDRLSISSASSSQPQSDVSSFQLRSPYPLGSLAQRSLNLADAQLMPPPSRSTTPTRRLRAPTVADSESIAHEERMRNMRLRYTAELRKKEERELAKQLADLQGGRTEHRLTLCSSKECH